jgi:hypothetical protein
MISTALKIIYKNPKKQIKQRVWIGKFKIAIFKFFILLHYAKTIDFFIYTIIRKAFYLHNLMDTPSFSIFYQ